jgi:hypothetical protein
MYIFNTKFYVFRAIVFHLTQLEYLYQLTASPTLLFYECFVYLWGVLVVCGKGDVGEIGISSAIGAYENLQNSELFLQITVNYSRYIR